MTQPPQNSRRIAKWERRRSVHRLVVDCPSDVIGAGQLELATIRKDGKRNRWQWSVGIWQQYAGGQAASLHEAKVAVADMIQEIRKQAMESGT